MTKTLIPLRLSAISKTPRGSVSLRAVDISGNLYSIEFARELLIEPALVEIGPKIFANHPLTEQELADVQAYLVRKFGALRT